MERNELDEIHDKLQNRDFKGALLSTDDLISYLNYLNYPKRKFNIFPHTLYVFNSCIYFPKTSCISNAVNRYLEALSNGGFVLKWASFFVRKNYMKNFVKDKSPQVLMNTQMYGTYMVYGACLVAATLVFLLEVISLKLSGVRNFFEVNSM